MEIINSYDKLPLGMYLEIYDLCEDTNMEEDDRQMEIISILSGKSVDDLLRMPIPEFKRLSAQTKFLEEEFPHGKGKIPKVFHFDGMTLEVTTNITKMTTAQYVDFQTFSEMGRSKLVELLSCFFIPKGMEYNEGYDVLEVQDVLRKNLSVTEALTLSAFFLNRCRDLIQITLIYSALMLKKATKKKDQRRMALMKEIIQLQTDLQNNGDGWTMLCQWWKLPMRHGHRSGR